MQLFCFLPKLATLSFAIHYGGGDLSQPEFCFPGFFFACPNFVFELFPGHGVISFAIN
jgi:hypothetical protein